MPLFKSYDASGAGIAKDAPRKKPFFRFWELVGRKFWKLLELNVILMLEFLPLLLIFLLNYLLREFDPVVPLVISGVLLLLFVVLFGPVIAGCTQVLRLFSIEKPCFMMDTFFKAFRSSFKQACPLGMINLLVTVSVASASFVYPRLIGLAKQEGQGGELFFYILFVATLSLGIEMIIVSFYAYLMIVSTELNFVQIMKNALVLSLFALKTNLLTLVLCVLILGLFVWLTTLIPSVMLVLWLFLPLTFVGFLIVFNCYPVIRKYIIDPYYTMKGEVNPEMSYTQTDGENLFEDQGGREAPIEPKKKGKKGKIIS